ncbi:transposase [Streptomyces sp. NPDC014636]|uniref:transposase n=1 Tax=Streptomyces sp. NPDC014636 TaxID=3364876 RepID=UPI0036FA7FA4
MELDDPRFHHSVLADFRDRLTEDGRADRLLDLALARLKEAGLVRERTTQRADSTHVLAAVRDLTRLELITEAVRAALQEVAGASPHLLDGLIGEDWGLRYGRPVRLGKNPTKPKTRILATGNDAVRLLEHLYRHGTDRTSGPRIQALRQIMVRNYHRDAAGHLRWRTAETEGGPGLPPSSRAVVSPYGNSARYAVRSGVEGTVNEFAHGHGMRRCRYRGQSKAHVQHVLTTIAINIERLSGLPPTEKAPPSRRPTAFQSYLDRCGISRPKSWRTLGT